MSDKWEFGYIAPGGEIKKLGHVSNLSLDVGAEYAEDTYYDTWNPEPPELSLSVDFSKEDSGFDRFMIALGLSTFKYEEHVYPAEYFDEMDKLGAYLKRKGIEHQRIHDTGRFDNYGHVLQLPWNQIIVFEDGERVWDAVCHNNSYGHEEGLLEIMGDIVYGECQVEGWLTAADVIERIRKKENKE